MALKHKTLPAGTDRPGFTGITPSLYAEEHSFSGGAHGSVLVRNTGASDGSSWIASAAGLFVSSGTNQLPSFSSTISSPIVWGSSGFSIPSQAAGDIFYAPTSATIGRVNGTGLLKANGSSAPTIVAGMYKLHENTGTDSSAGATNVDTYAFASGITIKDTILVISRSVMSAGSCSITLYNSTDSLTTTPSENISTNTLTSYYLFTAHTTTAVHCTSIIGASIGQTRTTFTTSYAGAWTIALRHGGVTTGPLNWNWTIYRIAGQ